MKINHTSDYQPRRAKAYPEIGEQLDLIYKGFKEAQDRGEQLPEHHAEFVAMIKAIKDAFPKPE